VLQLPAIDVLAQCGHSERRVRDARCQTRREKSAYRNRNLGMVARATCRALHEGWAETGEGASCRVMIPTARWQDEAAAAAGRGSAVRNSLVMAEARASAVRCCSLPLQAVRCSAALCLLSCCPWYRHDSGAAGTVGPRCCVNANAEAGRRSVSSSRR
jgi:hypothetical protein